MYKIVQREHIISRDELKLLDGPANSVYQKGRILEFLCAIFAFGSGQSFGLTQ